MRIVKALACASLFLTLFAMPSLAADKLSGGELRSLFPGRFQAVVSGFMNFRIVAKGDGSLSAVSPRGKKDRGRWSVRSGKLCIEFNKWLGGRTSCTPVVQEAGWYKGSMVKFKRI
jgi:hypothetical protein